MDHRFGNAATNATASIPRSICTIEDEALRRMALLELNAGRSALESLLGEILAASPENSAASYLLYDVLSRIDRIAAEHEDLPQRGLNERLSMIRGLQEARTQDELRSAFWRSFDEITHHLAGMPPPGHPAVEQVKAYVRQNFKRKLSLTEIARAVGISRNYLSHLFKKHCGVTVTEFIHRIRLKEAEKLLADATRPVSAIAYSVGYQNYRDFHRNFVKYQKTSPKKFRQVRLGLKQVALVASV